MAKIITGILLVCCSLACKQANNTQQEPPSPHLDYSRIAILSGRQNIELAFEHAKPVTLSTQDLEDIEGILTDCIHDYNLQKKKAVEEANANSPKPDLTPNNEIIVLSEYYRQYVAVTNSKGEKEVWINCLCEVSDMNWKEKVILVNDGGACYFSVKINLSKRECYAMLVNGDA